MRTLTLLLVSVYTTNPEYNQWCDGKNSREIARPTGKVYGKNSWGRNCLQYDDTTKKLTFRKDYDCVKMNSNPSDGDLESVNS